MALVYAKLQCKRPSGSKARYIEQEEKETQTKQLIDILAGQIDLPAHERLTLAQLNPLEAASVLAQRYGGARALKAACAQILSGAKRHSLQHALLAGLPFKGTVTTNFDELFELAVAGTGKSMAVRGDWLDMKDFYGPALGVLRRRAVCAHTSNVMGRHAGTQWSVAAERETIDEPKDN